MKLYNFTATDPGNAGAVDALSTLFAPNHPVERSECPIKSTLRWLDYVNFISDGTDSLNYTVSNFKFSDAGNLNS